MIWKKKSIFTEILLLITDGRGILHVFNDCDTPVEFRAKGPLL